MLCEWRPINSRPRLQCAYVVPKHSECIVLTYCDCAVYIVCRNIRTYPATSLIYFQREISESSFYKKEKMVNNMHIRGAIQNFREFDYTAQTVSATNLRRYVPLFYLSTNNLATGVFISARVSKFWLFSLHHFHECLRISKWRALRSKELALNFASSSTVLQLRPTEC